MKYPIHYSVRHDHTLLLAKRKGIVDHVSSLVYYNSKYSSEVRRSQLAVLNKEYELVNDQIKLCETTSDLKHEGVMK